MRGLRIALGKILVRQPGKQAEPEYIGGLLHHLMGRRGCPDGQRHKGQTQEQAVTQ